MLRRQSRGAAVSGIAVAISLLVAAPGAWAGITSVSVTLTGPSQGWVGDQLGYQANGGYTLDAETQEEVDNQEATVTESYSWAFGGGTCTTLPADSSNESCQFDYEDGGQHHTVSVTYIVRVTYADETYDEASDSDSKDVKVQRLELTGLSSNKTSICAGAVANSVHRATITATITNGFGESASGKSTEVSFTITAEDHVNTAASVLPASQVTTSGSATTVLTSSDKECTVTVQATVGTHAEQIMTCDVPVALPSGELDVGQNVNPHGAAFTPKVTLTHGLDPVPSHSLDWRFLKIWDEDGNLAYDREGGTGSAQGYGTVASPVDSGTPDHGETTYLSGSNAGVVFIDVRDETCYNSSNEHPYYGVADFIVCRLASFEVDNAYQVGETTTWAASIQNSESYVVVTAVVKPWVGDEDAERLLDWSLSTGWPQEQPDPRQWRVSRTSTGTSTVRADMWGQDVQVVTIKVVTLTSVSVQSGAVTIDDDNAATAADPDDTAGVILTASLSPSLTAAPEQLLMWSEGQAVADHAERRKLSKTNPARHDVVCECGDSSDDLTVWVIEIDLGIAGVSDNQEDTTPGEVYVNSDDDNDSGTQDKDESQVAGENDLIAATVTILPEDVPAGTVTVGCSSRLSLWEDAEKNTAWSGSCDLSTDDLPGILWVEGKTVSGPGDQSVTMDYDWSTLDLEDDQVLATVLPRKGESEAYLKVFTALVEQEPLNEKYDPIGGTVYPFLYIKIGPGERVKGGTGTVFIRVKDEYDDYEGYVFLDYLLGVNLALASGWEVWDGDEWDTATEAPASVDNKEGAEPILYRYKLEWKTHEDPLGNNGPHSLEAYEQIQFEKWDVTRGWTKNYDGGPAAKLANCRNVYMADATASNGTIDYFKWDPDGDVTLAEPHITFEIVDADPHKYAWQMRFRQTVGSGTWDWDSGWWWMEGTVASAGEVDINLTSIDITGHLDSDTHPTGMYTFEILVLEYEGETPPETQAESMDWQFLKRYRDGYHLWVPEHLPEPNEEEDGHDVWLRALASGEGELLAYYCLHSEDDLNAEEVNLIAVDPDLAEKSSVAGPTEVGAGHGIEDVDQDGRFDGIRVRTLQASDSWGDWRVVFTASDSGGYHSPHWRTHEAVRMLPVNVAVPIVPILPIGGDHPADTTWYGAFHWLSASTEKTTEDSRGQYRTPIQYIEAVGQRRIEVATNGGFFWGGSVIGDIGVGSAGIGQWLDEQNGDPNLQRWAVGWRPMAATTVRTERGTSTKVPPLIEANYAYGLSGIGCLHHPGSQWLSPDDQGTWPGPTLRRARTAIAWANSGAYFFQIVAEENEGWTWDQTVDFFQTALPQYMSGLGVTINLGTVMMLDGGGSSALIYRTASGDSVTYDQGRPVPNFVRGKTSW